MFITTVLLAIITTISGSDGCMATNPSNTPTTTPSASETTTTASGCTSCTQGQITFEKTDGGIEIDTSGIFGTDPDTGCLSLVATCTADEGYYSYMQFNTDEGGPEENSNLGRTINAELECVDGNWVYTSMGISRIVTTVSCNQAPNS